MFRGEPWSRELWLEWADLLTGLFWEGAGRPMPDEWHEWSLFRAEWYRALMDGGKESGFIVQARR